MNAMIYKYEYVWFFKMFNLTLHNMFSDIDRKTIVLKNTMNVL